MAITSMVVGTSWSLLPGGAAVVMAMAASESSSCFSQDRVMKHAIDFRVQRLVWSRYSVVVLSLLKSIVAVLTSRLTVICIFSLVGIAACVFVGSRRSMMGCLGAM
jgi:uncharacterized membrane protein